MQSNVRNTPIAVNSAKVGSATAGPATRQNPLPRPGFGKQRGNALNVTLEGIHTVQWVKRQVPNHAPVRKIAVRAINALE